MKISKYISILAIVALSASCSKQGPIGLTGPQGPSGQNGNVNVSSSVYTIGSGQWTSNGNGGWDANISPSINPTQGAVSILFSYNDTTWYGLPYVGNVATDADINYAITASNIQIQYVPQTGNPTITAPDNNTFVRISLIPSDIQKKYPNTNWQNASEVYRIPEVQAVIHNANNK